MTWYDLPNPLVVSVVKVDRIARIEYVDIAKAPALANLSATEHRMQVQTNWRKKKAGVV